MAFFNWKNGFCFFGLYFKKQQFELVNVKRESWYIGKDNLGYIGKEKALMMLITDLNSVAVKSDTTAADKTQITGCSPSADRFILIHLLTKKTTKPKNKKYWIVKFFFKPQSKMASKNSMVNVPWCSTEKCDLFSCNARNSNLKKGRNYQF